MNQEKKKVYVYTRVSTAMQIDGYSLDAQRTRMLAFAEFNEYEIAGEYEDAGKSGKSIEGRDEFNRMMEDIKTGKDDVSFVLVFKLSRFGRNAADVLSTLQTMQDFGVNLICVEDGIDSSKDAGKLMISVLSAVAHQLPLGHSRHLHNSDRTERFCSHRSLKQASRLDYRYSLPSFGFPDGRKPSRHSPFHR